MTLKKKLNIRRILFLAVWMLLISGLTTLLIAANKKQKEHRCSEVLIGIRGSGEKFYVEKDDILAIVERSAGGQLLNRPVASVNLSLLEKTLEKNSWIRDAELYFDSKDALHVYVEEREPVARVFATSGRSFYIDSSGHQMALVKKLSARVPVITGYVDIKRMNAQDSAFMKEVKEVIQYVYTSPFWNAQVGQIDIRPDKQFELVPVIGDHIIRLGSGKKVAVKLDRLYAFYRQVMTKVGFDKYAALDIRFENQVIGVKREPTSPIDSIQLQKNIEELMNRATLQEVDDIMLPVEVHQSNFRPKADTNQHNDVSTKTNPNPSLHQDNSHEAKLKTPFRPIEKPKQAVKTNQKPKALMKKNI